MPKLGIKEAGLAATHPSPDVESSTDLYARRFAGPVGDYLLEMQRSHVLSLLSPWPGARVLDVGGGHAQLATPMAAAGYDVTVLGSTDDSLSRVRRIAGSRIHYAVGPVVDPPFDPQSVDVVVAVRMLAHVPDWRDFVRRLCVIARRAVIVDFASSRSVNALSPALFNLKKRQEGDTRGFAIQRPHEVREAFAQCGFGAFTARPQFVLPMALHRALRRPAISRSAEGLCRAVGLTAAFGSPVLLRATPEEVDR